MTDPIIQKIDSYLSRYPKRTYPKGHILVFADESPEHVFYITKGRVRKYDVSYRGDEVVVNVFKPPAFFPLSWAINHTPNHFFYKTETAAEMHVVPAQETVAFLKDNPDIMFDLLSRIYSGMEGMLGRMVQLMSGTARHRLIYDLLIACRRFGEFRPDGSCELRVSEQDLAEQAGLTRETVSREMKYIKSHLGVQVANRRIVVKDLALLEEALQSAGED